MALSIRDALRIATKDPQFANTLVSNPESVKTEFNLSDAQVTQLKNLHSAALTAGKSFGVAGRGIGHFGPQADYD